MREDVDIRHRGRWQFVIAGSLLGLYAINVALRILFIKFHVAIFRVSDVGEFLLVLVAMAFFVSGVLSIEEVTESSAVPVNKDPVNKDPTGGKP